MSPKIHCFGTITANYDLFALSVEQVALKKSENIPPKHIHKYISKKIITLKFTESKINVALSNTLEGGGVYMLKKL